MRSRATLTLAIACVLSASAASAATQLLAPLPDGRKASLACLGGGSPTAIVEMGWGVPDSSWQEILPGLAAKTRVCLFDRPGYGDSDPGPMPRDTMASVRHSLGNLPLIILQAAASPDDERSLELAAMAQDSSRGTHRIIANSRHYIYRDQPDIVIKAFGDIVDAARGDDPAHELVLP